MVKFPRQNSARRPIAITKAPCIVNAGGLYGNVGGAERGVAGETFICAVGERPAYGRYFSRIGRCRMGRDQSEMEVLLPASTTRGRVHGLHHQPEAGAASW